MPHTLKSTRSSALDIVPKPLSIRSIEYRPAAHVVNRVRGEFAEMRGFSPTVAQAAKLFDLSTEECDRLLRSLEREGFLRRMPDGPYRLPS